MGVETAGWKIVRRPVDGLTGHHLKLYPKKDTDIKMGNSFELRQVQYIDNILDPSNGLQYAIKTRSVMAKISLEKQKVFHQKKCELFKNNNKVDNLKLHGKGIKMVILL